MSLIEVHFHESEFDFAPSLITDASEASALETEADDEAADEDVESAGWEDDAEPEQGSSAGLGAVVALVVLVALGAVVGWKRRGSDDEDVELDE
ncbi:MULTISPECIES: hypothetical protein [Halobacterium]|uniref:hypothetical protein n=1 Tax=Halobacterium TaxID=2239 RepID=UPI00073F134F|nr:MULTISPECIES: hypothetical protein [Halobacterium]MCG1003602.1 hypothetical protein [Halobacterium noricense]